MKLFVMLIMMSQIDPSGYPYTTPMQESPRTQYDTLKECETEAAKKRKDMLKSSLKYPELGIVDVIISCVEPAQDEFDPSNIQI